MYHNWSLKNYCLCTYHWWQWSHYHYSETSLNLQMSRAFIRWNSSKKLSHLRAPPFLYNVTLTLFSIMAGSGNWPGLLPAELRTWICCLRSPISLLLAAANNLYCSSHLWFTSRIFSTITEHSLTLQVEVKILVSKPASFQPCSS